MWLATVLLLLQPDPAGPETHMNSTAGTTAADDSHLTTAAWLEDTTTPPDNASTTSPAYSHISESPFEGKDITLPMHSGRKHSKNSSNITITPSHTHAHRAAWPPLHVMWQRGQGHGRDHTKPTRKPFFRPQSALSRNYRNFRLEPELMSPCWPHCKNTTVNKHYIQNKRRRKHGGSQHRRKYYNYKRLYDTLKHQEQTMQRQETQFYAWIFGATLLSLGALTSLTSCLVFCLCSDKWKRRKRTKRFDKSGEYQRVDSISSMVDQPDHHETVDQVDSVTII